MPTSDACPRRRDPVAFAAAAALHAAVIYALLTGLGVHLRPGAAHVVDTYIVYGAPTAQTPREFSCLPPPWRMMSFMLSPPEVVVDEQVRPEASARPESGLPMDAVPPLVPGASASSWRPASAQAPMIDVSHCDRPDYPVAAARAGATGTTVVAFAVDALGHVSGAQVLRSAGPSREHKLLDRAAVDALGKCAFKAGVDESGQPVGGNASVEYAWTLN